MYVSLDGHKQIVSALIRMCISSSITPVPLKVTDSLLALSLVRIWLCTRDYIIHISYFNCNGVLCAVGYCQFQFVTGDLRKCGPAVKCIIHCRHFVRHLHVRQQSPVTRLLLHSVSWDNLRRKCGFVLLLRWIPSGFPCSYWESKVASGLGV